MKKQTKNAALAQSSAEKLAVLDFLGNTPAALAWTFKQDTRYYCEKHDCTFALPSDVNCPDCLDEYEAEDDAEPSPVDCPACGDCYHKVLGVLGGRTHWRCRACGTDFSTLTPIH